MMNVALQPPKEDRLIVLRHISFCIMTGCTESSTRSFMELSLVFVSHMTSVCSGIAKEKLSYNELAPQQNETPLMNGYVQ